MVPASSLCQATGENNEMHIGAFSYAPKSVSFGPPPPARSKACALLAPKGVALHVRPRAPPNRLALLMWGLYLPTSLIRGAASQRRWPTVRTTCPVDPLCTACCREGCRNAQGSTNRTVLRRKKTGEIVLREACLGHK